MPRVTYSKTVSDGNVKAILQRIANQTNKDITVHSGDRDFVPHGGSRTSLHLHHRAADFHITGMSDAAGFAATKEAMNRIFDADQAYEFIHHGQHTGTGGPHLHLGRYGNGRAGYVKFKTEGLNSAGRNVYSTDQRTITTSAGAPVPPSATSGVTVSASVLSPNIGVSKSVGIGGINQYNDTTLVQILLNQAMRRLREAGIPFENIRPLVEDGDCGRFTKGAITVFQRDVLKFKEPDGRIDPGGRTIRALYVAAYGNVNSIVPNIQQITLAPNPASGNQTYNGILAWGSHPRVSDAFREKTVQISNELGITNPGWLMTVMAFETGRTFSPSVRNAAGSSGTGLIQFMRPTIDGQTRNGRFYPGLGARLGITHSQLAGMTALRQLDIVKAYFEDHGSKPRRATDVDDLYFLVLLPSAFGKGDSETMFRPGTTAYRQNSGLDTNRDGSVSVEETARVIRGMLREGLDRYPYPRR